MRLDPQLQRPNASPSMSRAAALLVKAYVEKLLAFNQKNKQEGRQDADHARRHKQAFTAQLRMEYQAEFVSEFLSPGQQHPCPRSRQILSRYQFLQLPSNLKERLKDKASAWYEASYFYAQGQFRSARYTSGRFGLEFAWECGPRAMLLQMKLDQGPEGEEPAMELCRSDRAHLLS